MDMHYIYFVHYMDEYALGLLWFAQGIGFSSSLSLEEQAFAYWLHISTSREFSRLGLFSPLMVDLNNMETNNSHNIMYIA